MSNVTTSKRTLKADHGFGEVLSNNAKFKKGSTRYSIRGLTLAPHKYSGQNVCPMAGFCAKVCVLWFAGRTVTKSVRNAAIARTKLFFADRELFKELLTAAIAQHVGRAARNLSRAAIRLNAASDLAWEKLFPELFSMFPTVIFYDYTKVTSRAQAYAAGKLPRNYHLTYSMSERSDMRTVRKLLESGCNCSLVVDAAWCPQLGIVGKLPKTITVDGKQFSTVDGDKHDLRIPDLDGFGRVVLLRGKGGIRQVLEGVHSGFIKRVRNGRSSTHELVNA
ncbi:GP88 family protein [Porticoccus sp.]